MYYNDLYNLSLWACDKGNCLSIIKSYSNQTTVDLQEYLKLVHWRLRKMNAKRGNEIGVDKLEAIFCIEAICSAK